ncbi:hypothetical protein ACFYKX_25320 [Cytobacillus sp. FJAT-54145]|uniref:Lipoprotein n=1 Tax=Cytobacillus spartinae TaxID=3299023 RepID=A0ABW6KI24_9BACI
MNKKTLTLLFSILCLLFIGFSFFEIKPLETSRKEKPEEAAQIETISPNEQDDLTVSMFIQELLGSDYTFLLYLFEPSKLTKDLDELSSTDTTSENSHDISEAAIYNYAQEVGKSIKQGKTFVQGKISNKTQQNNISVYTLLLTFSDGSQKQLRLEVQEGVIITPLENIMELSFTGQNE